MRGPGNKVVPSLEVSFLGAQEEKTNKSSESKFGEIYLLSWIVFVVFYVHLHKQRRYPF